MSEQLTGKWLLLIHQIPPKPDYFRVKIWRRLLKIGAVAIKQSVYVLPDTEQSYEDLLWIVKEIEQGKGSASLSRAEFLEGLARAKIIGLFQDARNTDYEKIIRDVQTCIDIVDMEKQVMLSRADPDSSGAEAKNARKELVRFQARLAEVKSIDFFHADKRDAAERIIAEFKTGLGQGRVEDSRGTGIREQGQGRTWVTRKGIYVDRIASAWLIKRFIDQQAVFKFVTDNNYQAEPDELCFDMSAGDFTHQGDRCTFEVLLDSFRLTPFPLTVIAELIHDIDLKDRKYDRPELSGIQALFAGLSATCTRDTERLERGSQLLNDLYASFAGN
jgi:hypothetical protein